MMCFFLMVLVAGCLSGIGNFDVKRKCHQSGDRCFPRVVWSYWDNVSKIPEDIEEMMNVTKDSLINFTYCLLSRENLSKFLDVEVFPIHYHNLGLRAKSCYIRVCLIDKYGGIWTDASIYITSGFGMEWFSSYGLRDNSQVFGFPNLWTKFQHNEICNNLFGASENSSIVRKWKEALDAVLNGRESPKEYVKMNCERLHIPCFKGYFREQELISFCYSVILNENPYLRNLQFLLPPKHWHYRLYFECERSLSCFHHRLQHDAEVRKYLFIKLHHFMRIKKRIGFYKG